MVNRNRIIRRLLPDNASLKILLMKYQLQGIARSPFTLEEIAAAENQDIEKHRLIREYDRQHPGFLSSFEDRIGEFVEDTSFEYSVHDLDDILFCHLSYGFGVDEYFFLGLQGMPAGERREFLSDRDTEIIYKGINDILTRSIVGYKDLTYEHLEAYYGRDAVAVLGRSDIGKLESFVRTHGVAVGKESTESSGNDVSLVKSEDISDFGRFYRESLSSGEYIFEEPIIQSDKMRAFNASSVNTVRSLCFLTNSGVRTPYCFFKMGREGSFVDNGAKGGILVGVNPETGELETPGRNEFGDVFRSHPDNGFDFMGKTLPDWSGLKQLMDEVTPLVPGVPYISWDWAHTDKGWVIVEGNEGGLFIGPQIAYQKGIKQEIIRIIEDTEAPLADYVVSLLGKSDKLIA